MADGAINKMDKLTDDNWSYWRKVMYAILKKEKVWDIVTGTRIALTGADASDTATIEFVAKQEKACGWLVPTISPKLSYLWPVTHRTTNAPTSESAKRSDGHNSYE